MATLADLQEQRNKFFKQKTEQAQGQIRGQTNENVGALQRRFTSMGAGGTGAAIAAEQKARASGLEQERQALGDIAGQQLQMGEQDIGRQFQSEEAERGRGFQSQEALLARQAQLGEAEKARKFQQGMAERDIGARRELFDIENKNKIRELDLALQQFDLDKDTIAFNKRMAEIQAGQTAPQGIVQQTQSQIAPYLTASGQYGVIPKTGGEALLQGAIGGISAWSEPVKNVAKDIAKRIGIKI